MKKSVLLSLICFGLTACVDLDESTYITDDNGVTHHSIYYTKDKRGRNYFPVKVPGNGKKRFIFDPKAAAWAAYDPEGNRIMTGGASGGKDFCEDVNAPCRTVTGTFNVYNKRSMDCKSGEFPVETKGGTKMPYCMYFFQGYTIHAGFEIPDYNASHGCIRVYPSAAKWLNEQFITMGTQVTVLPYAEENPNGE